MTFSGEHFLLKNPRNELFNPVSIDTKHASPHSTYPSGDHISSGGVGSAHGSLRSNSPTLNQMERLQIHS